MFTGIIEEVGIVRSITKGSLSAILNISCEKVLEDTRVGDSIAVNGVCLTVTSLEESSFTADVMAETLRRSSLGELVKGSKVNLERAMQLNGRFGGHIVSGHIDGTGTILSTKKEGNATWVEVGTSPEILRFIIQKGSITIDGISLTVAKLTDKSFSVSIIPHTGSETTLLTKKIGSVVNLENDIVGKYVERFISSPTKKEVSYETLLENGFI
ncbi:MAG: riboflavin synthase [Eubacterium sp.]|nr:riboflavin synthase [Eubacterium sp.]